MAEHQDLKKKGGADPDHQTAREHDARPPPLSIEVPKMRDLPNKSKPWSDVQLPVDILLLTVKDCEFLACYTYLKNAFKSYLLNLGHVYFGTMGESGKESLIVALMRCSKGSSGPSGSLVTIKNAVVQLEPKAVFFVGCCAGFNQKGTNLGDVVVSSTLTTNEFTTPVRRNIANLIRFSSEGWNPPLKDPSAGQQVQVHCDSSILSGVNEAAIAKQCCRPESHMIASETEGEGLFAAAHDLNFEWVVVRGISHFSNDSNTPDESWKSFASIMAASLVSNMLNDPVVFNEWPHYEDESANEDSPTLQASNLTGTTTRLSFDETVTRVQHYYAFHEEASLKVQGIKGSTSQTQGPNGTLSATTLNSVKIILEGLIGLNTKMENGEDDSSSESEDEQEQILAGAHPSVRGSPFLAQDPDTVGTFPVPPHPAAGSVLAGAVHGSSHGWTSVSGYLPPHVDPQHHFSRATHTHYQNTPSTICTPGRSRTYPFFNGSGLCTVTQGDSHVECLSVNEPAAALQRNTRPSTHVGPLPVYGQETPRPPPLPHYRAAEVPISVAHGFSQDTALVGVSPPQPVYAQHYSPYSSSHHNSGPSAIFVPGRSLGRVPYPGGAGMSTVTYPPEMQECCSPHETLRRPMHGLQPQTTIPSASNLRGLGVSTITQPPRIQETPRPPRHGLQHQSTIPDFPNLGGSGLSTDTLQPQIPELRASYGTPSPSLRELQPHHTFPDASYLSGNGLSTVTHLPGVSGGASPFGTIRPQQYGLQSQSVIPGYPHLSNPATSSVTHSSAIRFPSDGTLRPPLHGTHSQNASSVTYRPVIPGRFSPYETLRSHPPSMQS